MLERETGRKAIHVRLGASVPVTSIFKEMLGIDTLMFGFNLPDEDVHAPNEFFRLSSIQEGARAWTLLPFALVLALATMAIWWVLVAPRGHRTGYSAAA